MSTPRTLSLVRLVLPLSLFALARCGPVVENPTFYEDLPPESRQIPTRYTIEAGDELEIRFADRPEMDLVLPVRPDGYISLPTVQEVRAAGLAPDDLRAVLIDRFKTAGQINLDPAVIVKTFSAYRVHIGGRVDKPGVYPLTAGLTLFDSLILAGGHNIEARLDEVVVIRRTQEAGYVVIPIDLWPVIDGTKTANNIPLMPYDCVYVPPSPIGEVNDWVDLYIRKNIPINFGLRPTVP